MWIYFKLPHKKRRHEVEEEEGGRGRKGKKRRRGRMERERKRRRRKEKVVTFPPHYSVMQQRKGSCHVVRIPKQPHGERLLTTRYAISGSQSLAPSCVQMTKTQASCGFLRL